MMSLDYQRYYDLETFLFEDVNRRFRDNGSIGAFEFFSIVIWKANRAKSITATPEGSALDTRQKCGKAARRALCGRCRVTGIPTATIVLRVAHLPV